MPYLRLKEYREEGFLCQEEKRFSIGVINKLVTKITDVGNLRYLR